jgi:hypothetical protein
VANLTIDTPPIQAFARATEPFRAPVYTAALWYGGGDRRHAERVYQTTFALLTRSGEDVGRQAVARSLAASLLRVPRPRRPLEHLWRRRGPSYWEIVAGLAPDHAIPILLVGVLGLTHEQAAEALGLRSADVRRRIFLGRDTVVRRLGITVALEADRVAELPG